MNSGDEQTLKLVGLLIIIAWALSRARWRPSRTAFGTAEWATDRVLAAAKMFGNRGLILGRTLGGRLIRLPSNVHTIIIGPSGSGKGVSCILVQLLSHAGSIICFDTKGDLFSVSAARRKRRGHRIIRLAPFDGGTDKLNPLDAIPADSPMLVDHARALAEALVVRQGTEPDPHWNDKSVQVICGILVLVLLRFHGPERSLNSVQEIASNEQLLAGAADKLKEIGGLPGRLGNQLAALFNQEILQWPSREKAPE